MKRLTALALLALVASAGPAAGGDNLSGGALLKFCRAYLDDESGFAANPAATYCLGAVTGLSQARDLVLMAVEPRNLGRLPPGCPAPAGSTIPQLVRVVVRHLEEHPESHHLPAAAPAWVAITSGFAFQCDRK